MYHQEHPCASSATEKLQVGEMMSCVGEKSLSSEKSRTILSAGHQHQRLKPKCSKLSKLLVVEMEEEDGRRNHMKCELACRSWRCALLRVILQPAGSVKALPLSVAFGHFLAPLKRRHAERSCSKTGRGKRFPSGEQLFCNGDQIKPSLGSLS